LIYYLAEAGCQLSLGLLYSAFTYYTGFKVNSGQYKLMGLGPYGEPKYAPEDAFRCFMGSDIEVLAVGNCYLRKEEQDPALRID
jgi:predicted NodU family carbamoyl transferase